MVAEGTYSHRRAGYLIHPVLVYIQSKKTQRKGSPDTGKLSISTGDLTDCQNACYEYKKEKT